MEEGGVFDDERISSLGSNKRGREDDNGEIGRLEKKPSGMVIIEEYSGDEMINGVKYEEEKDSLSPNPSTTPNSGGGGLFNQLINNLVSPRASDQPHEHAFDLDGDKNGHVPASGENGNGGAGGGVINNLISGIFSSNGGDEVVDDKDGGEVVEDGGTEVVDNDNIVAKLPRTLSEDTVPATAPATAPPADEASILLHSIIHD